jgi:hypothetical protein
MSEPVTLSSDDLLLLITEAKIAGFNKAVEALREYDVNNITVINDLAAINNNTVIKFLANCIENKKEELLK